MATPLIRWLSFRVRVLCVLVFLLIGFLPPYVPRSAQALEETPVVSQQFLFVEEGFLMKTSSLGEQGSRLASAEGIVHTVEQGDNLDAIAKRYNISPQTIRWANNIPDGQGIKPDQELVILPVDGVLHTVRRGQTVARIAQLYEVPQEEIVNRNRIRNGLIVPGQQILIPGGKPVVTDDTIAASEGNLRFAEKLSQKDLQLRLNLPNKGGGGAPAAAKPGGAPGAGAELTQAILQMPCGNCFFTQYFSPSHYAVDIQTRGGGPIYAAEAGTVIRADTGWNGGYGNVIEVDHGNGLVTLYAHNKELYVKSGDTVTRGQNIAFMGRTGLVHGPTGIHIHFEIRVNGVKKNPLLYLQ